MPAREDARLDHAALTIVLELHGSDDLRGGATQ
jgi:hypothetical protein